MKCSRCKGKLALRIINASYLSINPENINDEYVVNNFDARWLIDETEIYCTVCDKVEENVIIGYDNNGVPLTVKRL